MPTFTFPLEDLILSNCTLYDFQLYLEVSVNKISQFTKFLLELANGGTHLCICKDASHQGQGGVRCKIISKSKRLAFFVQMIQSFESCNQKKMQMHYGL